MNQQVELIDFLNQEQDKLVFEPQVYSNQLTIAFANALIPDKLQLIFPEMRLHVERIDNETLSKLRDQLQLFTSHLSTEDQNFKNVWLTTSNITDRRLALVEISFE
ncbi:hypothetical protein Q2T76_02940 [Lactobacillus sp. YT155]|uniref:hypothetical protein n=1 Tax=Lactobacillus sp. YT155 TaxID=3060955 RepID=UPI00265D9727|nr:hypothetical protein [Lactobacillus sp. YT155]MDO1605010.1 hypothetical protein [Lactobacillus sp. YT155]